MPARKDVQKGVREDERKQEEEIQQYPVRTKMEWTCLQSEERLSDYLEGALNPEEARAFEAHANSCTNCQPMLLLVRDVLLHLRGLEEIDPPAHLTRRILDSTLGDATIGPRKQAAAWGKWVQWLRPVLRPQFALGATAAAFSLAVVLQFAVPVRWKKTVLSPEEVYHNVDRQTHLVYARGAKYVNDLRVVYEIQSRLKPESPPTEQPSHPHAFPEQKSEQETTPGHSSNRTYQYVALENFPNQSLDGLPEQWSGNSPDKLWLDKEGRIELPAEFDGEPSSGRDL